MPADHFVAVYTAREDAAIAPEAPKLEVSDDGWQIVTPAPWRRYLARQLDALVLGSLVWMAAAFVVASISAPLFDVLFAPQIVDNRFISSFVTYAVMLPVLAVLTGLTGSSPGKWIMGVRVTRRDGRPIGLLAGLKREGGVYLKGLGLALPLVSLITALVSHGTLTREGVTAWDKGEDWVVTHRPHNALQIVLVVLGLTGGIALIVALSALQ